MEWAVKGYRSIRNRKWIDSDDKTGGRIHVIRISKYKTN
jgi:hypothetical protein